MKTRVRYKGYTIKKKFRQYFIEEVNGACESLQEAKTYINTIIKKQFEYEKANRIKK